MDPRRSLGLLAMLLGATGALGCSTSTQACEGLSEDAQKQLETTNALNLACSKDADCSMTLVPNTGLCAAPCGVLTSDAVATGNAATNACAAFDAAHCSNPVVECIASGPFLCAGGTCAGYEVDATMPATIKVGACVGVSLDYKTSGPSPVAPHDLSLTLQVQNGMIFADATCMKPLSTYSPTSNADTGDITLPSGASRVTVGFQATVAGQGVIEVEGQIGGQASFKAD